MRTSAVNSRKTAKVKTAKVKTAKVKTAKVKTAKVKTAKVKTAKVVTTVAEGWGAGGSKSTPTEIGRLSRSGESAWQGSKVLRVFVLAGRKARDGAFVARIVKNALVNSKDVDYAAIVLPAGIGEFAEPFEVDERKTVDRALVVKAATAWVAAYRAEFGQIQCPVVLGVDGGGVSKDGKKRKYRLQTAVAFDQAELSVTFKSLKANGAERTWLVAPNDGAYGRLTRVGRSDAALQVCHDGIVRSGRGKAASRDHGVTGRMRAAMLPELERNGLRIFNVIHQLPLDEYRDTATSPAFQDSHSVLCNDGKCVVAVAGVPRGTKQADHFESLSEKLACLCPSDDVLIDAG
jgi:hypothetical protein